MAPWVHLHTWPDGRCFPCCMTPAETPVGQLRTTKLKDVWNGKKMRELRKKMLNDEKISSCNRCYELEQAGHLTLRQNLNRDFAHHFKSVEETSKDGHVEKINLPYFDIRFSNICNLRCRTCGPELSSSWYEDNKRLFGTYNDAKKIETTTTDPEEFWKDIEPLVPSVELIYFAGGEPLLMEEHYRILQILIDKGLTHVKIRYNTNFSFLKYKKYDVIELWKHFDHVEVGASLDAEGLRGEYMRKGIRWDKVVQNRERLLKEAPNVKFFISATLGILNAFHLPDLHRSWVEKGYIGVNNFNINLLMEPPLYSIKTLPSEMKASINQIYTDHIDNYLSKFSAHDTQIVKDAYLSALRFMNETDQSSLIPDFFKRNDALDKIRDEKMLDIFPELQGLTEYLK